MANTVAIPGSPQSPSPQHHPRPSWRLVRSDSPYFQRNCTISTMQFSLHSDNHDREGEIWYFIDCNFFRRVSIPSFYYLHHRLIGAFISVHFCLSWAPLSRFFWCHVRWQVKLKIDNQPECDRCLCVKNFGRWENMNHTRIIRWVTCLWLVLQLLSFLLAHILDTVPYLIFSRHLLQLNCRVSQGYHGR